MTGSADGGPRTRAPDFFIVGHHKSGTTALYEMLRRHPQIYMPGLKEPRWFSSDLTPLMNLPPGKVPATWEEYLALFDDAAPGQITGEASPSYLRSQVAAGAIAQVRPDARIIAILREPAGFVRSLHLQMLQEHVESERDLGRAIAAERIVRDGRTIERYADHVHYVEQLSRYRDAFPDEQILVLIYDDFRSDNEATVRRVQRFLGVDDSGPVEVLDANPTVGVRFVRLDAAMRALIAGRGPVAGAAKSAARAVLPGRLRGGAIERVRTRVVHTTPDPVDERVMLELRRRFRGEVLALGEYLGRDLIDLWGYGDIE